MKKICSLEDLQNMELETYEAVDKSTFRNYSKSISVTIGYLLGVKAEYLDTISESKVDFKELKIKLDKNENARAIRHLNNLRSNLILYFKTVSRTIRISSSNYTPIYQIDYLSDDFEALEELDINISTGKSDITEYLKKINNEIAKKVDGIRPLFPDWINFKYIRNMFIMPSDIENESKKYQSKQNCYPFKRYFNWKNPGEYGNILTTDLKLLDIIYKDFGSEFEDINKVMDASDSVKNNINEFIKNGNKVQIFIDGENVDPYRFAATIDSLKDFEIDKINKIVVYYDKMFSSRAWEMLKHFSCGVEVETIAVERIKENKSLVDHKLATGVSKAYYKDGVDSIILASSDSDFWSVIEDVEANYLVLVESDKCSRDFKEVLRNHNIFYCYLDKFMTPENNMFFKAVFRKELEKAIYKDFKLDNAKKLLNTAITQSRANISDMEYENLYNRYIKSLKLNVDNNGNFQIIIPE